MHYTMTIADAELGDDRPHVRACRDDPSSRLERRRDAGHGAARRGRWQGDDRAREERLCRKAELQFGLALPPEVAAAAKEYEATTSSQAAEPPPPAPEPAPTPAVVKATSEPPTAKEPATRDRDVAAAAVVLIARWLTGNAFIGIISGLVVAVDLPCDDDSADLGDYADAVSAFRAGTELKILITPQG